MVALDAAFFLFSSHASTSPKFPLCPKPSPSIRLPISTSSPTLSHRFPVFPLHLLSASTTTRESSFELSSTVEDIEVEEKPEETQQQNQRRKLFVLNLPWSFTVVDIKNVFGECGTVTDVEIIKQKNGKSRGFAFVTMESGDEAQAVVDKFNSHELLGRIIRVEFAKRLKKPSRPPPPGPQPGETRHKLYVSNLAWKVRSSHLREFFAANFNPVSARVVFDTPSGKSSGYGFVSFATKEEAEAGISALDGKELMDRQIRIKFSQKNVEESESEAGDTSEGKASES